MAFAQPFGQQQQQLQLGGHLSAIPSRDQRPQQTFYDYHYDDEDSLFEEINEFYAFIEADQLAENLKVWQGSFDGDWTKAPLQQRKTHVVALLEDLEHKDSLTRYNASRRLLYLLQGASSLVLVVRNTSDTPKQARLRKGITIIVDALKMLSNPNFISFSTHAPLSPTLSTIADADLARINAAPHMRQSWIDEVQAEIAMCLNMLYPIIEVFRSDDEFAEELMGMEPPLPIYFLSLLSTLGNRSAKSYPAKKLLLITWKVLLACLGGMNEQARAKAVARELAGLPPLTEASLMLKATPVDLQTFREETFVKYPTFSPPPITEAAKVPSTKLAEALTPLPVRNHYVHPDHNVNGGLGQGDDPASANAVLNPPGYGNNGFPGGPMLATPAPSPPPSPKPKKQQYQTDQTKPFVFPFSPAAYVSSRLVPYAIDEADTLYARHMHIPLALFQIWRTREDFILDESGLDAMPGDKESDVRMKRWSVVAIKKHLGSASYGSGGHVSSASMGGILGSGSMDAANDGEDEEETITWPDSQILEEEIEKAERELKKLDAEIAKEIRLHGEDGIDSAKKAERKRAKERRDDLMRLQRVEIIYAATLPFLSGVVVVLLKFLIAINNISSAAQNASQQSNIFAGQPEAPPPVVHHTMEELDALRHREIMIKGLSAFILLLLKWFKRSHIMKHHHLAFTLLSAATHAHILRLLSNTEVSTYVVTKNEVPERTFFRYCYENFSPNASQVRADEFPLFAPRQGSRITTMPHGIQSEEEVEMITDYSWRNFFAIINVLKILHKITKGNPNRITQLVHHKSSAILKRMMRISHPLLQLQILKLIKGQVPYSGRKWKQLNMKLITAIYLNCRPELRDEWLATMDVEEVKDSPSNVETFLRRLVAFYDYKRYGYIPPKVSSDQHQRSTSISMGDPPLSPEIQMANPLASPAASDVFPPPRSQAADPSIFMPYPSEDLAFEEEYEEYLFDLHSSSVPPDMVTTDTAPAWTELPSDQPLGDGLSDGESVASLGDELEDKTGPDGETLLPSDTEVGKNNWEHMSPKTLGALPKSPAKSPAGGGRRSSSGSSLRPVIPLDLDDPEAGSALEDEDEELEMGPMPIERSTPFAVQDKGKGVDEVEYMYGE
ncbi:SubName: Full=Probable Protein required for hyphal anastomosis (HAM-2) {ECO:0000313/EMBL:CCA68099.1} [Serendipita indica DSM 11827]|nr:SubName: Full=Probable Protein required for hyphal anastomosis (HAM-2) {ECO:0000313/EMBL:CCA68099.1} [Serendipita indica DSM 11827]